MGEGVSAAAFTWQQHLTQSIYDFFKDLCFPYSPFRSPPRMWSHCLQLIPAGRGFSPCRDKAWGGLLCHLSTIWAAIWTADLPCKRSLLMCRSALGERVVPLSGLFHCWCKLGSAAGVSFSLPGSWSSQSETDQWPEVGWEAFKYLLNPDLLSQTKKHGSWKQNSNVELWFVFSWHYKSWLTPNSFF